MSTTEEDTAAAEAKAAEDAAAATAEAEKAKADADAEAEAAAKDKDLGEGGKAALDAERKARKAAEKQAKEAAAKLKEREDADLSDKEKAEQRAQAAEEKVTAATDKLRKANLLAALADEGLTGGRAKAAAKLIDTVEYDDDDEPTNLPDAIKAATAEYGDDMFKAGKGKPPKANGGAGNEDRDGPSLTAEELAMAKSFGMTPEEYEKYKNN